MSVTKTLLLICAAGPLAFGSPDKDKKPENGARLEIELKADMLHIKSCFLNPDDESQQLRYKMFTIKTGRSGSNRNTQVGSFEVGPHEKEILAQTRMNLNPGDSYQIKLQVFRNNELVGQDSAQFTGGEKPDAEL